MAHDPVWMRLFLMVHIAAGAGTFVLAPIALATVKGGKQHRRWGMVYLWCMGIVAATAVPMALYRPVLFLALVAVFSFYAAFAGYRILKLKGLARGGSAQPIDWAAAGITFVSSLALALLGWFRPDIMRMPKIVPLIFGLIGMRLAYSQIKQFVRKPTDKLFWMDTHIGNFLGSYIASWSAFSVVTLSQYLGNQWWVWLWPTILGVPGLIATIAYFKRKYRAKVPTAAVA
jgi:hypothetical protein